VTDPPEVVVVGAGPAGLAAAAQLRRHGLRPLVLERGDALAARWQARYEGLRLNTFRAFSQLPGTRLPRDAGRYVSREAFLAYPEGYARDHGLDVRLSVEARRIEPHPDGGWEVVSPEGSFVSRHVVVATGWDAVPNLPRWTAEASFAGRLLHTAEVGELGTLRDRRVLVVGAGNSGIDLAGLLVRVGANVTMSMRTPPNVFPRDWLGLPLGPTVLMAEHRPSRPVDALGRFIQWQVYGNLSSSGIPHASEGFMTRFRRAGVNLAIDDGFVSALKDGRARIVGEVERLEAILIGGDRSPADDVICATGYRRGLEQLVGHPGVLDERGAPRYADGAPGDPDTPGLYFAGFRVALSGSIEWRASTLAASPRRSRARHQQGSSPTQALLPSAASLTRRRPYHEQAPETAVQSRERQSRAGWCLQRPG
jgi:putative flavoprotein involved in K+ transport